MNSFNVVGIVFNTMGYEVQTGMLALNTGNNGKRLMRHNIMIQVSLSISKKKEKVDWSIADLR